MINNWRLCSWIPFHFRSALRLCLNCPNFYFVETENFLYFYFLTLETDLRQLQCSNAMTKWWINEFSVIIWRESCSLHPTLLTTGSRNCLWQVPGTKFSPAYFSPDVCGRPYDDISSLKNLLLFLALLTIYQKGLEAFGCRSHWHCQSLLSPTKIVVSCVLLY